MLRAANNKPQSVSQLCVLWSFMYYLKHLSKLSPAKIGTVFRKYWCPNWGTLLIRGGQLDWVAVVRRQPPARRLLRLLVHLLLLHGLRAAGWDCRYFLCFFILNIVCSAWPDNKEKCTQLFDYCITYVENDSQEKGPFVTKVRTICIDNNWIDIS